MTDNDSLEIIWSIQSLYPNFYTKQTAEQAKVMAKFWRDTFVDYEYSLVNMALRQAILEKPDFPPTIADVNAKIVEAIHPQEQNYKGEEAWGEAWRLIKKYGNVLFHEQRERLEAEINKDDVLEKALRACGGLEGLRLCETDNINTLRAQFIRIYDAFNNRKKQQLLLPESMLREIETVKNENMTLLEEKPIELAVSEKIDNGMPESVKQVLNNLLGRSQ